MTAQRQITGAGDMAGANGGKPRSDIVPPKIPGWVSPITHPDNPHGGIPLSLDKNGNITLRIDPWLNQNKDDKADVLLNGSNTPDASKVIAAGEENQSFDLNLPTTKLTNGINMMRLRVTRLSQPQPENSPDLKVLFHTPRPGGEVTGSGDNQNLIMKLPADVVANGVNADRARQGVDVTLQYIHMRPGDVITLYLDGKPGDKTHTVTAAEAAAQQIVIRLTPADFWQDNSRFALRFRVTDVIGNSSGPDAIWSPTTLIDVHVKRVDLDLTAPKVLEAKDANGTVINFERDFYREDFATVEVAYTGSNTEQRVKAIFAGRKFSWISDAQTVNIPGQILTFKVPRLEVVDSIGSNAKVSYTVQLPGTTTDVPSKVLDLQITAQKHALPEPTLNAAKTNLRIYYPTLEATYKHRIALHGVTTRYGAETYIVQANYTDVAVPSAWLTENQGKDVMFNFTLKRVNSAELIIFSWCLRVSL
jgi:hypothetical protein